eukprot:8065921-Pyramimonas_sp.AAC.1
MLTGCLCFCNKKSSAFWGREKLRWAQEPRADCAIGAFGGTLSGATRCYAGRRRNRMRCTGRRSRMRTAPLGSSVEVPRGATTRCIGWRRRMRIAPPGPSVELPLGQRSA